MRSSPSIEPRNLICSGSSSSASRSARSPVSLQREKSEPAESEERRPAFSLESCSKEVEWSSGEGRKDPRPRFRKGIGTEVDGGMMPVMVGCYPQPEKRRVERRGALECRRCEGWQPCWRIITLSVDTTCEDCSCRRLERGLPSPDWTSPWMDEW